jgi:DNA-binding CsgD family transcriptional regulator
MTPVSSSGADRVVGRGNELSRLDAFMDDVADGPAVMLLEGESGIGKTTLLKRGVATAADKRWRLLFTRPAESEAKLSYAGLADLLRGSDDVLQTLPDPQRNALEVALLRAQPEEGSSEVRAVSAAVLSALREAAAAGPMLIALDDVQWLDPSTASALGFAVRRLESEPIGLLLARRETGASLPFGLSRAFAEERIARIRLEPLSVDDLGALMHVRLGANLPRPTLKRLHEMSGGNPFFALEIARAELRGERRPTGAALPIPQALREDLLRDRLRALPSADREMLLYASACSRPTVGLLQAVRKHPHVEGVLTKALDAGIVETDGNSVTFTHPLYGSAIYAEASRHHRHQVHRRLAEVVEDPEERARHLALASDGPDEETAAALEDAARAALGRGSPIAAAELCEMAERLTPPRDESDVRRRRMAASDYRLLAGDYGRALGLLKPVVSTAAPGPERAEALSRLGRTLLLLDDERGAADVLEEALREPGIRPFSLSAIHTLRARAVGWAGDLTSAERHAEEALRLAELEGKTDVLCEALTVLAATRAFAGNGTSRDLIDRAVQLEESMDPLSLSDRPRLVQAKELIWTARLDDARRILNMLLGEAADRGDEDPGGRLRWTIAEVELLAGNWQESLDHLARMLALAPNPADRLAMRAHVEACMGDVDAAQRDAQQAMEASGHGGFILGEIGALGALGFVDLSAKNPVGANRNLERAWQLHQRWGIGEPAMFLFVADHVEGLIELGKLDQANEVLNWLEERGQALDRPWALTISARYRSLLATVEGDLQAAFASIDRALKEHERLPMPFELGRTMLVLGTIRRRAKQKRLAREALEEALAIFEALGAPLWADQARAELARIGGRRAAAGQLTEAETRVARLAAAGRTNREIADALFMSVRTVEGHLSRAYAKLGVRSRTELALYIDAIDQSAHS